MRLFGVAMVRNEADVIEAFVRHNLTMLDGLVVIDHGSLDGTAGILAKLKGEGLPLHVVRAERHGTYKSVIGRSFVQQQAQYVISGNHLVDDPARPKPPPHIRLPQDVVALAATMPARLIKS